MIIEKIPETIKLEKDHLWIKLYSIDSIFRYDFDVQKLSLFSENVRFSESSGIASFAETREMLFVFPSYSNQISIYDVNTKSIIKKEILEFDYSYCDNAVVYKDCIYIINNDSDNLCILEFNIEKMKLVNKIDIATPKVSEFGTHTRILSEDIIIEDDSIYLVGGHSLIRFDMQSKIVEINEVESSIGLYVTMAKYEDKYVLLDEEGKCIITDGLNILAIYDLFEKLDDIRLEMSEEEKKLMKDHTGYKTTYMAFNNSFILGSTLYLIPGRSSAVITYDFEKDSWNTMLNSNSEMNQEWDEPYKKWIKDSNCIYLKNDYIYDFKEDKYYNMDFDKQSWNMEYGGVIKESLGYFNSLEGYIAGITNK